MMRGGERLRGKWRDSALTGAEVGCVCCRQQAGITGGVVTPGLAWLCGDSVLQSSYHIPRFLLTRITCWI